MKSTTLLASASFVLTGVIALVARRAAADDGVAVFEGTGAAYSAQGAPLGTYAVTFTRKQTGDNSRIEGKTTLANGQEIPFWEEEEKDGTGFRIRSSSGTGRGGCFANQICQMYRQSAGGHAVGTTVAVDPGDQIRVTETEYEGQQVVQYREETLKRKP